MSSGLPLRTAVVGVGYLGNFHAQKMKALAPEMGFKFIGVCEANTELREARSRELGVPGFSDYRELAGAVDLVTIATTTPSHFEIAKFFLEQGKHVNVEKPICLKSSEAEQLVSLATKNNLKFAVGHSERFSRVFTELKNKIKHPRHLELIRQAPFKRRGSEVSVIFDLMIHDLDLVLSLDASEVQVQAASVGQLLGGGADADWAVASLAFASGLTATLSIGRLAAAMVRTVKVIEDQQIILANFQTAELESGHFSKNSDSFEFNKIEGLKSDNLLLETKNFIFACQGKENLLVPGAAGLRALRCAEDVIAKARHG